MLKLLQGVLLPRCESSWSGSGPWLASTCPFGSGKDEHIRILQDPGGTRIPLGGDWSSVTPEGGHFAFQAEFRFTQNVASLVDKDKSAERNQDQRQDGCKPQHQPEADAVKDRGKPFCGTSRVLLRSSTLWDADAVAGPAHGFDQLDRTRDRRFCGAAGGCTHPPRWRRRRGRNSTGVLRPFHA